MISGSYSNQPVTLLISFAYDLKGSSHLMISSNRCEKPAIKEQSVIGSIFLYQLKQSWCIYWVYWYFSWLWPSAMVFIFHSLSSTQYAPLFIKYWRLGHRHLTKLVCSYIFSTDPDSKPKFLTSIIMLFKSWSFS